MSIFTKIIDGEIPGRFVWADEICVAMATIEPCTPGHVLIIPRVEVDKFDDVPPETFAHMAQIAQHLAKAQQRAFDVPRSIVSILGFEVPHTHIHVIPATAESAANLANAKLATDTELDTTMKKLREALAELGFKEFIPKNMYALEN